MLVKSRHCGEFEYMGGNMFEDIIYNIRKIYYINIKKIIKE